MKKRQKRWALLFAFLLFFSALVPLVNLALAESWDGEANQILLSGETATINGTGAGLSGNTVTISQGGTYVLKGNFIGQIVVDEGSNSQVILVLNGVNITSANGPAIWEKQSGSLTLVLATDAQNTLADSSSYTVDEDGDPNAALYVQNNLTIKGQGTLAVKGQYEHGIVAKDDLVVESGNITINAKKDGLRGRDSTLIKEGSLTITAGGDGIQANNDSGDDKGYVTIESGSITITAGEDGIQAESSLTISGGDINLKTASKGLKATNMYLNNGNITISSEDDAVNASGNVTITDGTYNLTCKDDGIHADEDLLVQGGTITINTQNEGMEAARVTLAGGNTTIFAVDDGINADGGDKTAIYKANGEEDGEAVQENVYINIQGGETYISTSQGDGVDSNGNMMMSGGSLIIEGMEGGPEVAIDYNGAFDLTGGRIIALGGAQMGQTPQSKNQSILVLYQAGEKEVPIILQNAAGEEILSITPQKNYQMVVITDEKLTQGESYHLFLGETSFTFENITAGINQLGEGGRSRGPGGRGSMGFDGGQPPQNGERPSFPEGENHPQPPEGLEPPEGMEMPKDMTPPGGVPPQEPQNTLMPNA